MLVEQAFKVESYKGEAGSGRVQRRKPVGIGFIQVRRTIALSVLKVNILSLPKDHKEAQTSAEAYWRISMLHWKLLNSDGLCNIGPREIMSVLDNVSA